MAHYSPPDMVPAAEPSSSAAEEGAGIYFWDIINDIVYTDTAAARLFGLTEEQGRQGLALGRFIERVHEDDRPRIAEAIQHAVDTGVAYHVEYRVRRPDFSVVPLIAIGQCFKNAAGQPSHYAGMLFEKPMVEPSSVSAVQLCLLAYEAALAEGNEEAADHIVDAIAALEGLSGERPAVRVGAFGN
jgi:hypothetical protein